MLTALLPCGGREDATQALTTDLLEALQRMVRRGHLPSQTLLVRLSDGRLKLNAFLSGISEARERLVRLRNEYGPVEVALWVSAEAAGGEVRVAVENLNSNDRGGSSPVRGVEALMPASLIQGSLTLPLVVSQFEPLGGTTPKASRGTKLDAWPTTAGRGGVMPLPEWVPPGAQPSLPLLPENARSVKRRWA